MCTTSSGGPGFTGCRLKGLARECAAPKELAAPFASVFVFLYQHSKKTEDQRSACRAPRTLRCQYLYFCTSKAGKASTSARITGRCSCANGDRTLL